MTIKKVQDGGVMTFTAPGGGVVSGTPVFIGKLFVIPLVTAAATVQFAGDTQGVYTMPKTAAQAWAEGDRIYWDAVNSRADNVPTVGQLIGIAAAVAANPTATGDVRLNGDAPDLAAGKQAAIAALIHAFGAADGTIVDVGGAFNQGTLNDNFKECSTKINAIIVALQAVGILT